jgi:hypothetical protein
MRAIALQISIATEWRSTTKYSIIHFNGLPSISRQRSLWTHGFLSAIHIHTLLLGPDPLSPWVIYAAMCSGVSAWDDLDLALISRLDPEAGKTLAPWFSIDSQTTFSSTDFESSVACLLVQYCDLQVRSSYMLITLMSC